MMKLDEKRVRLPQTQRRMLREWARRAVSTNRALALIGRTRSATRRQQVETALTAHLGGGRVIRATVSPQDNPWSQILAAREQGVQAGVASILVFVAIDTDTMDDVSLRTIDTMGEHLDQQHLRLLIWTSPAHETRFQALAPQLHRSESVEFLSLDDGHEDAEPSPWIVDLTEEISNLDKRIAQQGSPEAQVMLQGMRLAACLEHGSFSEVEEWFTSPQTSIAYETGIVQTFLPDLSLPDYLGIIAPSSIVTAPADAPNDAHARMTQDAVSLRLSLRRCRYPEAFALFGRVATATTALHQARASLEVGRTEDFEHHLERFHWNRPDYPEDWKAHLRLAYRFQLSAERARALGQPWTALQQELVSFEARRTISAWATLEGNLDRIVADCWSLGIQGDAVALLEGVLGHIGPEPSLRRARFLFLLARAHGWRSPLKATELLAEAVETFRIPTETVSTLEQPFAWCDIGRYEQLRSIYESPEATRMCLERAALAFRHATTGAEAQQNPDAAQWARIAQASVLVALQSWERSQDTLRDAIDWASHHEGPARVAERWLDLSQLALAKTDLDLASTALWEARRALDESAAEHQPVKTELRMALIGHRVDVANGRLDLALQRLQVVLRRVRGCGFKTDVVKLLHAISELGASAPPNVREDAALEASDIAKETRLVYEEARAMANLAALHPDRGQTLIEEAAYMVGDLHGGPLARRIRTVSRTLGIEPQIP